MAVHRIKPRAVSAALWGDAVSEGEKLRAVDEEVVDVVNIVKESAGEDFSGMIEDDIREHTEDRGKPFTN
ncbi:hypothetical protein TTRE_0000518701 [Trichuris trichiura]|uniref:Uncharacterized protein n=1 Tax=Trichuris trichiura TaxID=36087 RepID=A0A077ZAQ8_TRITR|nr:hypothetical protein TTRE_0000518701 [Trichuris trichiura]